MLQPVGHQKRVRELLVAWRTEREVLAQGRKLNECRLGGNAYRREEDRHSVAYVYGMFSSIDTSNQTHELGKLWSRAVSTT